MKKNEYYFISVVDKDLSKICKFSKVIEEKYNQDVLTGLNFAKTKDGNYLLGLTFNDKAKQDEALDLAKPFGFIHIHTQEENWVELITLAEMCIVGNFSYKMLQNAQENMLQVDIATYKRLKKAYEQAILEKKEIFIFENTQILVSYAKYLLQYLEDKLGVKNGNK